MNHWVHVSVILSWLLITMRDAGCFPYQPTWESLDARPLPAWYDEAKFGIFIHWGVFSVPSFGSARFWWYWKGEQKEQKYIDFMKKNYPPNFEYADFAPMFKGELFDPDQWADLFARSGAQYVVLTSKHHEGFTNWGSKHSWNWNSVDNGPHRDLVGDLAKSIRNRTKIHFGLYHSLFEFFNPLYLKDKANNFKSQEFVQEKTMPELYEIVNAYLPEIVWSDGDEGALPSYWNSTHFLAWLYNESPVRNTVVTNDRWGAGTICKHGGYRTCNDGYNPGVLQSHKWENCMKIDRYSWGYRREATADDYLTIHELVETLVETVSCGGNLLMNVGPTHDGRIVPIFEERLSQMGDWLKVNAEAIYRSKPWIYQNDTVTPGVWYTAQKSVNGTYVYASVLNWPKMNSLTLGAPTPSSQTSVQMLGLPGALKWEKLSPKGMVIQFPYVTPIQLPSDVAWVLKITSLQ